MPFLRTPPANDSDDTESITTSIEDREAKEYRAWAADQEFMENCIQVDGVIFDARAGGRTLLVGHDCVQTTSVVDTQHELS